MTRRLLSLFVALAIACGAVVSVSATEGNEGGWIELLEYSTVQENGENWIAVNGKTVEFTIDVNPDSIVRHVDMLIWHPNAEQITSAVSLTKNDSSKLTVVYLGNNITRIYGKVTNIFYEEMRIELNKATSTYTTYQLLSFRVTALQVMDFTATAELRKSWGDTSPLKCPANYTIAGTGGGFETTVNQLVRVDVTDWQKYDKVTLYGSFTSAALTSVRASIGNKGLPFEISYMESVPTGNDSFGSFSHQFYSHTETTYLPDYDPSIHDETSFQEGDGYGDMLEHSAVTFGGNVLYTITIDLTGIDRTLDTPLVCCFTILENPADGYAVNVQNVSGSIITADTTAVTWWTRFTTFMRELFPSKSEEGEDFEDEAENQAGQMEDLNNQLQEVTRPDIEDVQTDLEDYVSSQDMQATKDGLEELLNNQLVVSTLMISLTVSLVAYILYGKR